MKKVMITIVALGLVTLAAGDALAAPRRFRIFRPVAAQPAPGAARIETGYRAFSYEPGPTPMVRVTRGFTPAAKPGWMNATTKALGKY